MKAKHWLLTVIIVGIVGYGIYWFFFKSNYAVKHLGGTQKVNLKKGEKFMSCSWKDNSIWYTARPMNSTDTATTVIYREVSEKGILEGEVIFYESK